MSARAWLGLGGNLGDRFRFLRQAVREIASQPGVRIAARSPVYESEPWGDPDQPRFLNAVLALDVDLSPEALLDCALGAEARLGRRRPAVRLWGPRTIDIDVLLYGDVRRAAPDPVLPHPRLHERIFVIRPLFDLAPDLIVPGQAPVRDLLARLEAAGDGGLRPAGEWGA